MTVSGGCLCGAVRFEFDGSTGPFELCHCSRCRKATGSAFMAGLRVRSADFRYLSGGDLIRSYQAPVRESPPPYRLSFCSQCGSPLPPLPGGEDWIEIPAGLLDVDPQVRPDRHIYVEHKSPWYSFSDELPRLTRAEVAALRATVKTDRAANLGGTGARVPPRIRRYREADWDQVWAILEPVFLSGETYAIPPEISEEQARAYWTSPEKHVFVAVDGEGSLLGTYYLKANQAGPGDHVANCGYIVGESARGRGVASALCEHSLAEARSRGFLAMQFNFVVATNEGAIRLWKRHGFEVVGTLPGAFRPPDRVERQSLRTSATPATRGRTPGRVDALVMFREL